LGDKLNKKKWPVRNRTKYAYVFNSPVSFTDPTGFDCRPKHCGSIGGRSGGGGFLSQYNSLYDTWSFPRDGQPPIFEPGAFGPRVSDDLIADYSVFDQRQSEFDVARQYADAVLTSLDNAFYGLVPRLFIEIADPITPAIDIAESLSNGDYTQAAVAGTFAAFRVKGGVASRLENALPGSAEDIIASTARGEAAKGTNYLLGFLSPKESAAYLANPARGTRFLGTAVHRATAQGLNRAHPGRFDYNATRSFDFLDKSTGQSLELTTTRGVASHLDRFANIVTYPSF